MQASGGIRHLRGRHPEESGEGARSAGSSGSGGGELYCRRGPGGYPESTESRGGTDMVLEGFDQEAYEKAVRQEGYDYGICQLITPLQEFSISRGDVLKKLQEKYELSEEEAEKYMKKYW